MDLEKKPDLASTIGKVPPADELDNTALLEGGVAKADVSDAASGTLSQDEEDVQAALRASMGKGAARTPPLVPKDYQIQELLGQGTFGEVWRGQHQTTKVQVAIKFFRSRSATQLQILLEEAKKLAMLHSEPRIVRLLDVDAKSTPPYFVMDFAEQGSLAGRLARGPLPLAEALPLFRQVVEAMAYVHAKGIRHCDLKPGNILLDAAGRPRVADFGQAHLSIESTPSALGTFFYMAPEQATIEKQIPDTRWDVFGLGALLYAMLVGKPPHYDQDFKNELEHTVELSHRLRRYRERVQATPPPTEHRQVEGMDRALANIIDRCLAIDPAERWRDAGDLLAALDQRDRRRRLRPLLIFAILAPLLLMGAVGLFGYLMVQYAGKDSEATLTRHLLDSDLITAKVVAKVVKEKLDSASDKVKKFAATDNMRKTLQDYVAAPTEENRTLLEGYLARIGAFESKTFVAFTVFDSEGKLLARYTRRPENASPDWEQQTRSIYDMNFSWRDYFNRQRDVYEASGTQGQRFPYQPNMQGGEDAPYISQPFMSRSAEGFLGIGISAPVHEAKDATRLAGLLLGTINLRELHSWIKPVEDHHGCAVLLDRHGFCLYHLDSQREQLEPKREEAPPRWHDKSPVFQAVLGGQHGQVANYVDPIDGRAFLASYAPVPEYGWGVLVQHERAGALAPVARVSRELTGFVWLAGGLSGILLSAFWGWLLWVLLRKEEAHG